MDLVGARISQTTFLSLGVWNCRKVHFLELTVRVEILFFFKPASSIIELSIIGLIDRIEHRAFFSVEN